MKDVPDEELLIGQDGLDGVEVDVHFVLTGDEVLRLAGVGRMDVAHPVGLAGVVAVDVVEEFVVVVHLRSRQKKHGSRRSTRKNSASSRSKDRRYSTDTELEVRLRLR